MGRGGRTKQTGVTRHEPAYSSDVAVVGTGSGPAPEMANACMLTFDEQVMLDGVGASTVQRGQGFALVPGRSGKLDIMSGGIKLGVYAGGYLSQLLQCIKKKYIYKGSIAGITRNDAGIVYVNCHIVGMGLV